jgi:dipeptidyl aminopeptidase/acylaminoacyl peptidase
MLEDAWGVAGAPRDETSFEYDVEIDDHDEPPRLEGVPDPPPGLSAALRPFLEARRAKLAALSSGSGMLVLTRLSETTHVHQVASPLAMRRQLTFGPEPIEQAGFGPQGQVFYRADLRGMENYQIFRLHLESRRTELLGDGKSRHGPFRWSSSGKLAFTNNARNAVDMDLYVHEGGGPPSLVAELRGQWAPLTWGRDGHRILMRRYLSADQSMIAVVDVRDGSTKMLAELEPGLSVGSAQLGPTDKVYLIANRDRDHKGIFEVDLATTSWKLLTPDLRWDVEELALAPSGGTLAYVVNEDGYSELEVMDLTSGARSRLDRIEEGVISGLRFSKEQLGFTLSTPTRPADAATYDPKTRKLTRWTESEVGGLSPARFVVPELVRIASFDGVEIPAFLYRPTGEGPFPVLLWMHGGPEEQFRPAFDPIVQFFASSRRIAVLAPNVRGSDGYGKRFLSLDDGQRRHDAIADVGAVLDWIGTRADLDANRVGIHGASYGGFMVLASLVAFPKRFRAGSDLVGMSNLVTFLENTRDYRRELRRPEYGDENDPDVRAYLESISPLGRAGEIEAALLVAHGENDPRVPLSEAEQLVRELRARGREAWFFVARGEGHSFRKRRNRDAFYRVMAQFFDRHLAAHPVQ